MANKNFNQLREKLYKAYNKQLFNIKFDKEFLDIYISRFGFDYCRYFMYQGIYHQLQKEVLDIKGSGLTFGENSISTQFFPNISWKITNISDGYNILETENIKEKYDVIIADQVIEHVKEPWVVPAQTSNVLKENGACLIMTPFFYPIHPTKNYGDYFRYSCDGLINLFSKYYDAIFSGSHGNIDFINVIHDKYSTTKITKKMFIEDRKKWSYNDLKWPVHIWYFGRKKKQEN